MALARALAIGPSLVLLDEPFASLDASLRVSLRHDIRRVLKDTGATALLVTHDQDEALSLADRVALLDEGQIAQYDSPQELYPRPATPELARRLGETNFLSGRARAGCVETPLGLLELDTGLTPAGAIRDGAAVLVLVRAEQILLSDEPGAGRGAARVLSAEFYGHDAVVRLCPEWDDSSTYFGPHLRGGRTARRGHDGDLVGAAAR